MPELIGTWTRPTCGSVKTRVPEIVSPFWFKVSSAGPCHLSFPVVATEFAGARLSALTTTTAIAVRQFRLTHCNGNTEINSLAVKCTKTAVKTSDRKAASAIVSKSMGATLSCASDADLFVSTVWLLEGLTRSIPSQLKYRQGSLALLTEGTQQFETPLANVRAIFPWYYFGGGVKLTVYGVSYRISFVRPNGAAPVDRSILAYIPVVREVRYIRAGVRLGRVWKRILASTDRPH